MTPHQQELAGLLEKVGTPGKYYVEFGYNARHWQKNSNTGNLFNWTGLLLDIDNDNPAINLHAAKITSQNIVGLFRKYGVPAEPDFVSIDIDSADLWVLRAILSAYRPRVIQVEYNCNYEHEGFGTLAFPDPATMPSVKSDRYTTRFRWGRGGLGPVCYMGSSSASVTSVGRRAGYVVAGVQCHEPYGAERRLVHSYFCTDLLLVRDELVSWPIDEADIATKLHSHRIHAPMSPAMALNIVDYDTFEKTGDLCYARAVASRMLRKYARTTNITCFKELASLEPMPCSSHAAVAQLPSNGEILA